MSRLKIKVPQKLHRVEIIHAKDLIEREVRSYLPPMPPEEPLPMPEDEIFETLESFDLDHFDSLAKDNSPENSDDTYLQEEIAVPVQPVFYQQIKFAGMNEPIKLKTNNIAKHTLPIEDVQIEVQHAYERGFDDGQQLTRNTFEIELQKQQDWIKNIDQVTEELRSQYATETANIERTIASLSVMVAEHILGHEVSAASDIVLEQVKKAFATLDEEEVFKIRVHPETIEILENVKSSLSETSSSMTDVKLIPDLSVDKGGCILETSSGTIDARLKTQLQRLHKSLDKVLVNDQLTDDTIES